MRFAFFGFLLAFVSHAVAADDAGRPAAVSSAATNDLVWLTDLEAAKKQAAAEKKGILVAFIGSDWCVWCKRLEKEVFSTDEFKAQKDFVLVALDFPREKTLPEDVRARNEALRKDWKTGGFPAVVLLNAEGRPYARTGYLPGGPKKYLDNLSYLRGLDNEIGRKAFFESSAEKEAREAAYKEKLGVLINAGNFDAVCEHIDAHFKHERGGKVLAAFNKCLMSEVLDPNDKSRALKYVEEAIAEGEVLGNEPLMNFFRMKRMRIRNGQ
jgi:thioredoxin-related protein